MLAVVASVDDEHGPRSRLSDAGDGSIATDGDSFAALLRGVAAAPSIAVMDAAPLEAGTMVAERYRVEQRVGQGGMGVVYVAHDVRLARPVALKLHSGALDARGLEILRGEAQAMAHLAHPNVVEVFEVGAYEDRLFIAMEYVAAGTLRQWQREPRSWREVVKIYLEAGRGLSTAHRAGLVHRDFKPDNVLIGADGRPRVADFGLALAVQAAPATLDEASSTVESGATGRTTRSVVGTPRYMAPEQAAGKVADPRADQYSFCVALCEALGGELPTPGGPPGRLFGPGPAALWRAIHKGLQPDPGDRHPSMAALLGVLERSSRRRGSTRVWLATAGVAAAALAMTASSPDPVSTCARDADAEVQRWQAQREPARVALLSAAGTQHVDAADAIEAELDTYLARWGELRHAACRAPADDPRRDAAMQCLDGAGRAVVGTVAVLEVVTPTALAAGARLPLPSLDGCALDSVSTAEPSGPEPTEAEAVDHILTDGARVRALIWNGDRVGALSLAHEVFVRAEPLSHRPTVLYGHMVLADAASEAGELAIAREHFEAGFYLAQGLGNEADAVESSAALIEIFTDLGQYDQAEIWVGHARSSYERLGTNVALELGLLSSLGILRQEQGRLADAVRVQRKALALLPDEGDEVRRANAHNNLGASYSYVGEHGRAVEQFELSLALYEARRGPDHPDNVYPLANLAWSWIERGEFARAEPLLMRAIDLLERTSASDTYAHATLLSQLGALHSERGRHREAIEVFQRARRLAEPDLGADHVLIGQLVMNEAGERAGLGDDAQAGQLYERALGILERAVGPDHDDVALALANLAQLRVDTDPAAALAHAQRAVQIVAGPDDAALRAPLVLPLTIQGRALVKLGRAPEAVDPLGRALRIAAQGDVAAIYWVEAEFYLADALWEAGGDRERARAHAQAARGRLAHDEDAADAVAEIDTWLATHPPP